MSLISYINPLSFEGQDIVREKGNLNNVFNRNEELIGIIIHSKHQNISDDSLIPENIGELAIKRLQWYIELKNNSNYKPNDYSYFFNENIEEFDILTFHLLSQAIAIKFNYNSREMRLFIQSQGRLIEDRLTKLMSTYREDVVEKILKELMIDGTVKWTFLKELISSKKISLMDLLIDNGEIVLEKDDFLYRFEDEFLDRSPDRIYDIIVGENLKELILNKLIMQSTENYIKKIKEMSTKIEIHPNITKLGDQLFEEIPKLMDKYNIYYGSGGGYGNIKIGKLIKEAFPPCISNTIQGVSSGGRNDAIVLLLTSFISYARLYPSIFGNEESIKISDIDTNLNITHREILPIIYEAANNCSPPLFDDQPEEKINIISKLGFGMHNEINLENEGETTWYTPMSCEKIKLHLPQLCRANKSCKGINNPLSSYNRSRYNLLKEGELKDNSAENNKYSS